MQTQQQRRRVLMIILVFIFLGVGAFLIYRLAIPGSESDGVSVADREFSQSYVVNTKGDFRIFGNSLITCNSTQTDCLGARTGQIVKGNNEFRGPFEFIDVDNDASTSNSSTAVLEFPSNANVLWAGLFWGGRGTNPARNTIKLKFGNGAYSNITANQTDSIEASGSQQFHNITNITNFIKQNGAGSYTAGGVVADLEGDQNNIYAGWAVIVVFEDPAQPFRNIAVFDGLRTVLAGETGTITIPIAGFTTPATGQINTKLGMLVYEGDVRIVGDNIALNGQTLSNAVNPADNFFNSNISNLGALVSNGSPNYTNNMAMDIDVLNVSGILDNGDSSAVFSFRTNGDGYYPGAFIIANDIYSPNVAATNAVVDVNGDVVRRGDELEYTVVVNNSGVDTATNTVVNIAIPEGTAFVSGSLNINGIGSLTDDGGDDQAELSGSNIIFRIGTGASATAGGQLATSEQSTMTYRLAVNNDVVDQFVIPNVANVTFSSLTTNADLSVSSNEVESIVFVPVETSSSTTTTQDGGGGGGSETTTTNSVSTTTSVDTTDSTHSTTSVNTTDTTHSSASSSTVGSTATSTPGLGGGGSSTTTSTPTSLPDTALIDEKGILFVLVGALMVLTGMLLYLTGVVDLILPNRNK